MPNNRISRFIGVSLESLKSAAIHRGDAELAAAVPRWLALLRLLEQGNLRQPDPPPCEMWKPVIRRKPWLVP